MEQGVILLRHRPGVLATADVSTVQQMLIPICFRMLTLHIIYQTRLRPQFSALRVFYVCFPSNDNSRIFSCSVTITFVFSLFMQPCLNITVLTPQTVTIFVLSLSSQRYDFNEPETEKKIFARDRDTDTADLYIALSLSLGNRQFSYLYLSQNSVY